MLHDLIPAPPDPLLKIMQAAREDPRANKLDLSVGVYCDEHGRTPVMRAVKEAEARVHAEQTSKIYVGQVGDREFVRLVADLTFGPAGADMVGAQTVGGTGALRLGAELLRTAGARRIVVPAPSWSNHGPIIAAAGLERIDAPFFNIATQEIAFDAVLEAINQLSPGDAVLVQGCCHNPLGADIAADVWRSLAEACAARDVVPFIDIAYQGFGEGPDEDMAHVRQLLAASPQAIVAVSGAKTFGVYRERVGALFVHAPSAARPAIASTLNAITRANYSMPPDHGAATVRTVLANSDLRAQWADELAAMRSRMKETRAALAALDIPGVPMAAVGGQRGMFSTLPLSEDQIAHLRNAHAVFMPATGRINIAGFGAGDVGRFADALRDTALRACAA